MFHKILLSTLLVCITFASFAQNPYYKNGSYPRHQPGQQNHKADTADTAAKKGFDPKKLVFGGSAWLQFGNYTYIELSPLVGYKFTDNLTLGAGPMYQYVSVNNIQGYNNFSNNVYGGRVFGQYRIASFLVAHAEYHLLNASYEVFNYGTGDYSVQRSYVPGLLLGGGYRQPVGEHSSLILYVLYDVLYDDVRSPYTSPLVINLGFLF